MDIDEDDDFYAPEEPDVQPTATAAAPAAPVAAKTEPQNDELEEGEEEDESGEMDEDDDSVSWASISCSGTVILNKIQDIDIITERKDGSKPAPPS